MKNETKHNIYELLNYFKKFGNIHLDWKLVNF